MHSLKMERINLGLQSPHVLGIMQNQNENIKTEPHEAGYVYSHVSSVPPVSHLLTPKRGETMSSQVKAFRHSAFTPTDEKHSVTNLQAMTPITPLFTEFSTPKNDSERPSFWVENSLTPDTPGRKTLPERTLLSDRLSKSSPFSLTPERQPLDFMSPDRNKNQDSGRRGRPRADMVNNLIIEGAQSGNPIKCKICSR